MTDIQKIINLLLPELIAQINSENTSVIQKKGLDNKVNPSIHTVMKGNHNGRK